MIIVILLFAALLIGAGIIYFQGVSHYKSYFVRGIRVNGIDCSDLTPETVSRLLNGQISTYVLEVSGRDPKNPGAKKILGRIHPADVGMTRKDTASQVDSVFARQNPYTWYRMYWEEEKEYHFDQEIEFEPEMLYNYVSSWDACSESETMAPRDAYISEYVPEENAYLVIPDSNGSRMDAALAIPAIEKALYSMENRVDIEDTGCYNNAKIKADDKTLNAIVDKVNSWLGARICYDWYGTELVVDKELLKDWVSLRNGKPVLDGEAVMAFVADAKKQYDPQGHTYVFHTTLGVDLELKCKSGWVTDAVKEGEELISLIGQGAVTDRRPVSETTNYVFFDGTVGDSYAEVDLTNQHVYFYYKGELYLETDCVSGDIASGHNTPEGIYAVTFKQRDRILRGPGYESFVHYWMPFYGGYGMHDAMWRRAFGGNIYLYNGSHGCVNLPLKNAEKIYTLVETGFPVVCYYYPQGMNPLENQTMETAGSAQAGETPEGQISETPAGEAQGTS
ncbi:MAG: L,D-transpeptidase, partial [Lachnospiraceae bacterium]|nr:L,D-transpeptidase [Lachnospiraceae bacterium]